MTQNEIEAYDAMMADRDSWKERFHRLAKEKALRPLNAATCSVCEDVIQRLGGHKESRLDGETGLAAATMRSHEALLRVCDLLEAWKITLKNRNGITWDAMDAGDTQRLKMSIDHLEAAISPPNSSDQPR